MSLDPGTSLAAHVAAAKQSGEHYWLRVTTLVVSIPRQLEHYPGPGPPDVGALVALKPEVQMRVH